MPLPSIFRSLVRRAASSGRLGVVAGDTNATAAVVDRGAGKPRVTDCQNMPGDDALKALSAWRAKNGLSRAPANLLLGAGDYQILPIDVAELPPEELADAARWKVKDMIDFPPEEASVACLLVPGAAEAGRPRQALAVVTPRKTVAQWMQRMVGAHFDLTAIDIPELALRNIALLLPGTNACGLLHVGLARTTLVMVWQGELCTFRRFDLGAAQLLEASPEQRETLIERLGLDLQRTSDAFERQFYAATLGPMRVIEELPGLSLATELSRYVNTPVQPLNLRDVLDIDHAGALLDPARGVDFVPAIGAALRDEAVQP